jgi:hypothetical protein
MDVCHQRDVGSFLALQQFDGCLPAGAHSDGEASLFEDILKHMLQQRFILDDQHVLLIHVARPAATIWV